MSSLPPAADASADAEDFYFNQNPPPKDLERHVTLTREFVARHQQLGRRVVLVTSGGTTVPLEKQTVRFSMCLMDELPQNPCPHGVGGDIQRRRRFYGRRQAVDTTCSFSRLEREPPR